MNSNKQMEQLVSNSEAYYASLDASYEAKQAYYREVPMEYVAEDLATQFQEMATKEDVDVLKSIKDAIIQFESSGKDPLTPYQDNKSIWTIGHGTNLEDLDEKELEILGDILAGKESITPDIQDKLLDYNIQVAFDEVEALFPGTKDAIPEIQQLLVDMHYNMGGTSLGKFTDTRKAFTKGDLPAFIDGVKDSTYYKKDLPKNKDRYKYINKLMEVIINDKES